MHRRNRHQRAKETRLALHQIEIRQRTEARTHLAEPHRQHILGRRHGVALRLNAQMLGDIQCAFAVEALGNDDEVVGVEDFARAHNRVQRTETGIIQHDVRGIDAGFD